MGSERHQGSNASTAFGAVFGARLVRWLWATSRSSLALVLLAVLSLVVSGVFAPAFATKPVDLTQNQDRLDLTLRGEAHAGAETLQIEAAAGADGVAGRMSVRAQSPGSKSSWFVVALRNTTDKAIERWVAADRYAAIGSGIIWPDLDARRIENITPSIGFLPDRITNDRADVFRLTLEPGQVVTYAIELSSSRVPRLMLWTPLAFEKAHRERQLFHGILLGVTGLLAIFLTAVFAANHKVIFPSAALFTWAVIAYLCVDFGFWHQLFNVRPEENAQYRAAAEAAMVAALLVFLHTFLRLGFSGRLLRFVITIWMIADLLLIGLAFLDPRLGATFARISAGLLGGLGGIAVMILALRNQDRALALLPTWILFGIWLLGAALGLTGRLTGDLVVNGLSAGLVIIVVLIGFTVTQFAFRAVEPLYGGLGGESDLVHLAVQHSGASLWEWSPRHGEVRVGAALEAALGMPEGAFPTKVQGFLERVHPTERERLKLALDGLAQRVAGEIRLELRLKHADNSYRWFELDAASLPTTDRQAVRTVGLIREISDAKLAAERLLHDAVHDSLTGLPNRPLFNDRLAAALARAKVEPLTRPLVLAVGIDRFRPVATAFGIVVSESLIKTVARRLQRHIGPTDTLARLGPELFGVVLHREPSGPDLAAFVEELRRAVRAPIAIAGHDVSLGVAIGIATFVQHAGVDAARMLAQAEAALEQAKLPGAEPLQIFKPGASSMLDEAVALEADLMAAIDGRTLQVLFEPICYLRTEVLAGFEARLVWDHGRLGRIDPTRLAIPDEGGQRGAKLSGLLLQAAVAEAQRWHKELPRAEAPLFVSVDIGGRALLTPTLVAEVRHLVSRSLLPKRALHLEFNEAHVMDNPEEASQLLVQLHAAGVGIALDDFGVGYTSLCYLNALPAETIKVGAVLLHAANQAGPASAVLRAIVSVAREMGRRVIVEGVETDDDVGLLRAIGVEYAQGPHYGRAVNAKGAFALVTGVKREEKRLQSRRLAAKPRQRSGTEPVVQAPRPTVQATQQQRVAQMVPQSTAQSSSQSTPQPLAPVQAAPVSRASDNILAQLDAAMMQAGPAVAAAANSSNGYFVPQPASDNLQAVPQAMPYVPVYAGNGGHQNGPPPLPVGRQPDVVPAMTNPGNGNGQWQGPSPVVPPLLPTVPLRARPLAGKPQALPPQLAASLARLAGRAPDKVEPQRPEPEAGLPRRSSQGQ